MVLIRRCIGGPLRFLTYCCYISPTAGQVMLTGPLRRQQIGFEPLESKWLGKEVTLSFVTARLLQ